MADQPSVLDLVSSPPPFRLDVQLHDLLTKPAAPQVIPPPLERTGAPLRMPDLPLLHPQP